MGCGACVSACPEDNIRLVDVPGQGLRPLVDSAKCQECGECVKVCPGIAISHQSFNSHTIPQLRQAWGPVLEVWEGYAADPEIRFKGSSGGVATAMALFCLEKEQMTGVLHIGADPEFPLRNAAVFSKSREELLACTGSRYSPAAPCQHFDWIENADCECVFIGKPCDVAALRKVQAFKPLLKEKVALTVSIFCAGTPTTNGTLEILDFMGVEPSQVKSLRYRGCGWPGMTTVEVKGSEQKHQMAYNESWGDILSKNGQLRCRLCPDGTGEFADISCGDPWHREIEPDEPGHSLVLVRTKRGREILKKAIQDDYIMIEQVEPNVLSRSQKALLKRRSHLWGRLLALRAMRIPVPHFEGFCLFSNWRDLSAGEKIRSIAGTFKRALQRGWKKPLRLNDKR